MRLGEIIKKYRVNKDQTVRELAEEIGIPFPTLSRIENGAEVIESKALVPIIQWLFSPTTN